MELKHVIPNMEKTFGNLEFAGENKVEQRRINGRMAVVSRSFNLYSDVQRADDIVVVLPASAGEKNFEVEERIRLINPKITAKLGMQRTEEGCLSCPGIWGYTERPMYVTVRAFDRFGNQFEKSAEGLKAKAFCHEIDHLDGILFTQKVVEFIDAE